MDRDSWGKVFIFLLVIGLPLLNTTLTLDPGLPIRFLGVSIATAALSILLILRKDLVAQNKPLNSALIIIFALFVIYLGFRISGKYVQADSFYEWLKVAVYFILLIGIYLSFDYQTIKPAIIWSLSMLGIILAVWGLIELITVAIKGDLVIPLNTYEITAAFEHRNLFAQILFLTLPFQLFQSLNQKKRILNFLFLLTSILTIFILIVLSNRATWLAIAISSLVVVSLFLFSGIFRNRFDKAYLKSAMVKLSFITTSGIILAFLFFVFFTEQGDIQRHASAVTQIETGSGKDRSELWQRTIQLAKEKPLFGHGLANWKIEVLKHGNEGLISEDNVTFYQRPHNDYLWKLSESGIIGLLLYLSVFVWVFIHLIKGLIRSKQTDEIFFLYTLLFAISGFMVYSFFSFPGERMVHNVIIVLLISTLVIRVQNDKQQSIGQFRIILPIVMLLISIVGVVVGIYRFNGEMYLKKGFQAKDQREYKLLNSEIIKAQSKLYQMDPTSTPLSWYSGFAYYQLNSIDSAIICFEKARQINPYHIHVLNNLASSYFNAAKPDSAIKYYKQALDIAPNFNELKYNLSAVYFNEGNAEEAYEVLKSIPLDPEDSRLKTFVKTIMHYLIIDIYKSNEHLNGTFTAKNEDWYFERHQRIVNENISLEKLIFEEDFSNPTKH